MKCRLDAGDPSFEFGLLAPLDEPIGHPDPTWIERMGDKGQPIVSDPRQRTPPGAVRSRIHRSVSKMKAMMRVRETIERPGRPEPRGDRLVAAAASALALLCGPAASAAQDYALVPLLLEGDLDPHGRAVQALYDADIDDAGRVAASGHDQDGTVLLYVLADGAWTVAVAAADPVPGVPGETFGDVARPRLAAPASLVHIGSYGAGSGLFARIGGSGSLLVPPGLPADGSGTITDVPYVHGAIPAIGGVSAAFGAEIDDGGPSTIAAHAVVTPTGLREIYRQGGAAPAAIGGTFAGVEAFHATALADDGTATFASAVNGATAAEGLFRSDPVGNLTTLLTDGDAVATPGGGTFTFFARSLTAAPGGAVAFAAEVLRAPIALPREAIFVREPGGGLREITIRQGDPIPGLSPPFRFQGVLGSSPPEVNDAGVVVLTARLEDAGLATRDAVLVHDGAAISAIVRDGDGVPGLPGARFTTFDIARIAADGRIVIVAHTTAGRTGVFLATPVPPVPALPWAGTAVLATGLGVSGWRRLRRLRASARRGLPAGTQGLHEPRA